MPKFVLVQPFDNVTLPDTPEMAATNWDEAIGEAITFLRRSLHAALGRTFTFGLPTRTQQPIFLSNGDMFTIRMIQE